MTVTIDLLLYVLAAICFLLATFGVPRGVSINLTALGLLFWVLTNIF